jgi:hypothetical protein
MKKIEFGTYSLEEVVAIVQQALIAARRSPDWCPGLRQVAELVNVVADNGAAPKRRMGRPKGSKNKPKPAEAVTTA